MSRFFYALPDRLLRLLNEARWLLGAFAGVALALILLTYDRADPGWSNAGPLQEVHNLGGRFGAWGADLLLYLFGASAWLCVALISFFLWRGLRRARTPETGDIRSQTSVADTVAAGFDWAQWLGIGLLFCGMVGLESQRMHSLKLALPFAPGGVTGDLIADLLMLTLGPTVTTVVLLGMIISGLSLLSGLSVFAICEKTGFALERFAQWLARALADRQDRVIGAQAALERDGLVDEKKQLVRSPTATAAAFDLGGQALEPLHAAGEGGRAHGLEPSLGGLDQLLAGGSAVVPPLDGLFRGAPSEVDLDLTLRAEGPAGLAATSASLSALDREPSVAGAFAAAAPIVSPAVDTVRPSAGASPVAQQRGAGGAGAAAADIARPRETAFRIDPPAGPVEKSARVLAEAQTSLFGHLEGADPRPSVTLLAPPPVVVETVSAESIEYTSRLIEKKLADFGVAARVTSAQPGPVITRYEIEPATGVKGSQIVNLSKDLARALSLTSLRVVETIPGKNVMGLELPNARRQTVRLSEILSAKVFADAPSALTMALGKDISGHAVVADLMRMPHLLVAGTTGSGKSVGINAMLLSLLYKSDPAQVRLILIDPKMLEMSVYEGIPHLLAPVVTDMRQAANALNWCVAEMERRYRVMSKLGVRNLAGFNTKIAESSQRGQLIPNPFSLTPDAPEPLSRLPQIVVVIDELADLMMVVGKKIEELIARLAQKARAAGIHLILATQRPSVDVITGLIKANIPTRIAFQVSSKIDSRTILDQMGAESLLGMGDMLYLPSGSGVPMRVHGAFVADEEVHRVVEHWKTKGDPDYVEGLLEGGVVESADTGSAVGFGGLSQTLAEAGVESEADPMYDQAVAIVLQNRRASISLVQRHLRIGYNRAARLLEQMEKSGLVSSMATNGNRDVLVPSREEA